MTYFNVVHFALELIDLKLNIKRLNLQMQVTQWWLVFKIIHCADTWLLN